MTLSAELMNEGASALPAAAADSVTLARRFESISEKLCLFVLLLGLSNIAGWIFDIQFLKSTFPGASNMKLNAALGLILLSVSLLMLQPKREDAQALRLAARLCSSAAILIGSITLVEYITGWDTGFNQLFIKERPGALFTPHPGQPSPLMALNLALAGLAIIGIDARAWRGIHPGRAALCVTGLTSLLTFIGHIDGVPHLLQFLPGSSAIAFNAALGMLVLTFAILFARPGSGVAAIMISGTAGGVLVRRMLFPSVIFMIVIDWLLNFGGQAGLYSDAGEAAIHNTLLIAFFTGIIIDTARRLKESDIRRSLAEHETHQREVRYRELFDNASDFVYTHDLTGVFTTVNKALCDGSGYSPEELIGAPISKLVSPASIEKARTMTEAKLKGASSSTNYELEIITKNGETILVEVHSRLIMENGKPVGVQGIGRDIGERKAAERVLRSIVEGTSSVVGEQFFNSILQHLTQAMKMRFALIAIMDDSGMAKTIAFIADGKIGPNFSCEIRGTPSEYVVGKPYAAYPDHVADLFPDDHWLKDNGIESYIGVSLFNTSGKYLGHMVIMDTRPVTDVEQYISVLKIFSVRAAIEMERTAKDEKLRESEALLNIAQRLGKVGGWEFDVNKQTLFWTDEVYHIHDMAREDTPSGSPEHFAKSMECYSPESQPLILAAFQDCVSRGVPYDMEFPFISAIGRKMWIRTAGVPLFDNDKVIKVVGYIMDITESKTAAEKLKVAKEEAETATRMKDKFISLLSHDLRAPLSSVILLQKVTVSNHRDSKCAECKTMLGKAIGICETMLTMTDELLESARLQTGVIQLNRKICGIKAICETVMEDLNDLAVKKEVVLKNELPDDIRLYVDRVLFQRVIHNMVVNALKFSNKGGAVTIFLHGGNNTQVAVKDTGTGIDERLLPDLFKHEVKTSTTGTSGERGTGFGLPMCMDIVKAHGGTIQVTSAKGEGATFIVEVPEVRPLVLVVDGDEASGFILGKYLQNVGVEVLTAAHGARALEIVQGRNPALVITDIVMPVMDGFTLLQKLKNSPKYSHIPVLMITGSHTDDVAMRQKAFECKADDFIVKPLSEADFIPRINRFIAG